MSNYGGTQTQMQHSPWKYSRFWELVLNGYFNIIFTDKKIFKVGNIVKNIAAVDVILMSIMINKHASWLEVSKGVPPREIMKKVFLKTS